MAEQYVCGYNDPWWHVYDKHTSEDLALFLLEGAARNYCEFLNGEVSEIFKKNNFGTIKQALAAINTDEPLKPKPIK